MLRVASIAQLLLDSKFRGRTELFWTKKSIMEAVHQVADLVPGWLKLRTTNGVRTVSKRNNLPLTAIDELQPMSDEQRATCKRLQNQAV